MEIIKSNAPQKQDLDQLIAILAQHDEDNHQKPFMEEPYAFYIKDGTRIVGGVSGSYVGKWLKIDLLAVSKELRGKGYGRQLMEQAETAALARGCRYSLLSTLDFQGIDFYPRFGYKEVLRLPEFPETGFRVYFVKTLNS